MKLLFPKIAVLALAMFAHTSPADEVVNIAEFAGCQPIASKTERLLCYDTVAAGGVYNEELLQEVQEENFGNSKAEEEEDSIDRVSVTIVKVSQSSSGRYYFYTEDGKTWKQSNSGRWSLGAPFEAEIKAGSMGSFFLVPDGGKSVRVKRVR